MRVDLGTLKAVGRQQQSSAANPCLGSLSISSETPLSNHGSKINRFSSKAAVLHAVRLDGNALRDADIEFRKDREVVLASALQAGAALELAAGTLRADRDLVMQVVTEDGRALEHAAAELQADVEVVRAAVTQHGLALRHAAPALRAQPETVLAAVRQHGVALQFAADGAQGPQGVRGVVLVAVAQAGSALQYASAEQRADWNVVAAAAAQNIGAVRWAVGTVAETMQLCAAVVLAGLAYVLPLYATVAMSLCLAYIGRELWRRAA